MGAQEVSITTPTVSIGSEIRKLGNVIARQPVNLFLFKSSKEREKQLMNLKDLKKKIADVIVVITGSENVQNAAEILATDATNVFPLEYNLALLGDRVDSLFR